MRLWRWILAVPAALVCTASALHLTGSLAPLPKLGSLVLAGPTPAQLAVRKQLDELAGRARAGSAHAEDLAAAIAFYSSAPLLWVGESGISERGKSVIDEIRKADDWGLRAADFALPKVPDGALSTEAAATAEIAVTLAVLKYARHARGGRLGDLQRVSKALDYKPPLRRPADVLSELAASLAPDATLRSLHPQHVQFQALRGVLVKLRGLKATAGSDGADKALRIGRILVNMERWRFLPADLGDFHVWNNVPEFLSRVVRKGEVIHTDKIVAGQPDWPTPSFSADMKTLVFHPSWGVPDGIRRKELLPRLINASQPGLFSLITGAKTSKTVLEQLRLQVYHQGRLIDPDTVDWSKVNIAAYEFRQPPGPENPLGLVKFNFPNRHDVYMHDTTASERDLFGWSFRGFSHGCMRVAEPRKLAAILLAQDKGWSEEEVAALFSGSTTRTVTLATRIPVHMTYFTAVVDEDGTLHTFADLYGLDARMGALLPGAKVPFVTPSFGHEIERMQTRHQRPSSGASSAGPSLAEALASIFQP